jgi:hypothetical protein
MNVLWLEIGFGKQVFLHVVPVGLRVFRAQTDVFIQIEAGTLPERHLTLQQIRVHLLHGAAGGKTQYSCGILADTDIDQSRNQIDGRSGIWTDDDFHY